MSLSSPWYFQLVMRTQGSLRLILNTKLWAQMQIDKASEKSIRITAMDTEDQGVKVFLILVRPRIESVDIFERTLWEVLVATGGYDPS